jgi:hypothetical protein
MNLQEALEDSQEQVRRLRGVVESLDTWALFIEAWSAGFNAASQPISKFTPRIVTCDRLHKELITALNATTQPEPEVEVQQPDETAIGKSLLWRNHGCPIEALYGDDGKMDCNKCLIDFKALSFSQIEERLFRIRKREYDAAIAAMRTKQEPTNAE